MIKIIITRNLYCTAKCSQSKLRGAGHCTSAKRMTSILRHVAEAFPPKVLNSHRVIGKGAIAQSGVYCNEFEYVGELKGVVSIGM